MEENNNYILQNADTFSLGSGLSISSKSEIKQAISVTNNRAHYFANLAKKYRDEAKIHSENAKHYAEENSNVTYEQLIDLRTVLETEINQKQEIGDYALKNEIPARVDDLEDGTEYVKTTQMNSSIEAAVDAVRLPDQSGNYNMVLSTDGENLSWKNIITDPMFGIKILDYTLDFEKSKGYALQGTYVYKEAASERYGYPDFYSKCLEEKTSGTPTQVTLGNSTITMYVNSNGHQFYEIADKAVVDAWYTSSGNAWFYGVDEENERIFLPRSDDTNQSKYVYIIVGNTEVESTITDVTEITTSENDTIPLFTGMYFDFNPDNPSWLKAGEQINSGGIYTSCYSALVNCLNGENSYNLKVIGITSADLGNISDESYSDYWKVNQDEMYFITPTKLNSVIVGQDSISNLYFKVANAVQNLELLNTGEVLEVLADKVGSQEFQTYITEKFKAYITETYHNGTSWYRVYSDGWCEQGGRITTDGGTALFTVTLLKSFRDTNYTALATSKVGSSYAPSIMNYYTGSFSGNYLGRAGSWRASGYVV